MYSRHWKTGKLFAVFTSTSGVVKLKPGETLVSIRSANGYFEENLIDAGGDVSTAAAGDHLDKIKVHIDIAVDTAKPNKRRWLYLDAFQCRRSGPGHHQREFHRTGTAFSYQITPPRAPTSVPRTFPAGLSVSTGDLSGTPTMIGTSSVTISAANASGTGSHLSLSVYSACDLNRVGRPTVDAIAGHRGPGRNGLHVGFKPRRRLQYHRRPKRVNASLGGSSCPRTMSWCAPKHVLSIFLILLLTSSLPGQRLARDMAISAFTNCRAKTTGCLEARGCR